jgi:peptidoglycan L-alanyl-D-glutamate endopeptidase CwlK
MDCSECQDKILSATSEIFTRLKDYRKSGMVDDQAMAVIMALVRRIEQQVASKVQEDNQQNYQFGVRSLNKLRGVHPNLVACVTLALYRYTPLDFAVIDGVRTIERQRVLVEQGRSWTLNSKHLPQADGYAHAVDIVPLVGSGIPWDNWPVFESVAKAMFQAAKDLKIALTWGGNWPTKKDGPHYQM